MMKKSTNATESTKTFWSEVSIKFIVVTSLFLVSIFLFAFIAHETINEKEDLFDATVSDFLSQYMNDAITHFMRIVTFFGSHWFLIPAYIFVVLYFLFTKKKRVSLNIAIIAISSTALIFGLKQLFQRDRPDLSLLLSIKTYSFPSGHALSSFIFCCVLIYLVWESKMNQIWKWLCATLLLIFSLLIGISRIVLKLHYASDVLAGFCLGFVWVILSFLILKKIRVTK